MEAAFNVTRCRATAVLPALANISDRYDALLVNYKFAAGKVDESLLKRFGSADVPKVLFIGTAEAANIPSSEVLDQFGLIFKREHFRDLDRYPISDQNKSKFRTTMLECPPRTISRLQRYRRSRLARSAPAYRNDVFFSGSTTGAVRTDVWETVVGSGLTYSGGLQLRRFRTDREQRYRAEKLGNRRYLKTMLESRINLALEGYGEFTFRHLEIWCAGAVMISTKSLRELVLPLDAREGVHYITFDNVHDLEDKLGYYAHNDVERERIARAGRDMFMRDYNPVRHGKEILRHIKACSA